MSIPTSITDNLSTLLTGVKAAYPLSDASLETLASLQAQAFGIVNAINVAFLADNLLIVAPTLGDVKIYATAIEALAGVAQETTKLAEMRALASRAALNIVNAGA